MWEYERNLADRVKDNLKVIWQYIKSKPMTKDNIAEEMSCPLQIIFQICMSNSTVPVDWKRGRIEVLFKTGCKKLPAMTGQLA